MPCSYIVCSHTLHDLDNAIIHLQSSYTRCIAASLAGAGYFCIALLMACSACAAGLNASAPKRKAFCEEPPRNRTDSPHVSVVFAEVNLECGGRNTHVSHTVSCWESAWNIFNIARRRLLKLHRWPSHNTTSNGGNTSGVATPRRRLSNVW